MDLRLNSLAPRVIASLVAVITATSFAVSGTLMLRERDDRLHALEASVRTAADYAATALVYPVWNVIHREMDVLLRWVFREESVYAVVLRIPDISAEPLSYVRGENGEAEPGIPELRAEGGTERRPLFFDGRPLGSLEIHYTAAHVYAGLRREMTQAAVLVLILDVVLGAVLFAVLRRAVLGPLARMERWAEALERGDHNPDAVLGAEGRGEIRSLRNSITGMVGIIRAREREYRSLFENSPVSIWELDFSELKKSPPTVLESAAGTRTALRSVRVRAINPISLEWLGISSLDQLRGGLGALLQEDALALAAREVRSLAAKGPGVQGECRLKLPSGEIRWYMVRFATLAGYEEDWSRVILSAVDISDRAEAEGRLVAALAEKELLVKELFHRTRNSLQMVSSLISLREPYAEDCGAAELRSLRSRIETIALAQDQLYGKQDLSILDMGAFIRNLVDTISQEYPAAGVAKEVEVDMVPATIDQAVPMGMILYELVANAYRHAFRADRGGTLRVGLNLLASGNLELTVRDDGPGFSDGFDPRRDGRFGLGLAYALGEGQLGGSLSFSSDAGLGCTFLVSYTGGPVRV